MIFKVSNDDLFSYVSVNASQLSLVQEQSSAIEALNPVPAAASQQSLTGSKALSAVLLQSSDEEELEKYLADLVYMPSSDEEYETASSSSSLSSISELTPSSSLSGSPVPEAEVSELERLYQVIDEAMPQPVSMQYENQAERMKNLIADGDRLLARGEFAQALDSYRTAHSVNPESPLPWIKGGELLMQVGHLAEAARTFQKAIEIEPGYLAPYLGLAEIYTKANDLASAIKCYAKVLQLEPFHETANEKQEELIKILVTVD